MNCGRRLLKWCDDVFALRKGYKLAVKKYNLEEVEELWRHEPDSNKVFRAATEDIDEYPPEIQAVIKEEAERRREAKPQRNTIPKQKKVKVYRVLGRILSIYGIIGYIAYVLKKIVEVATIAAIIDALFMFVFNIFLWAGLILLWRADKNEYPDRKSNWLKTIRVYVILSVILSLTIIIVMLVFPIIVKMVR